jgi:hypothetical protein
VGCVTWQESLERIKTTAPAMGHPAKRRWGSSLQLWHVGINAGVKDGGQEHRVWGLFSGSHSVSFSYVGITTVLVS